jgi:hypothetical protein
MNDEETFAALDTAKRSLLAFIEPLSDEGLRRNYLNKVVADLWAEHELSSSQIISESGRPVRIAGDARCDSMGHR